VAVQNGSACLWDTVNGREALTLQAHNQACTGVAFRSDGTRLMTASLDGLVKVWNGAPWRPAVSGRASATTKNGQ
jgi:WD40 repeat protein